MRPAWLCCALAAALVAGCESVTDVQRPEVRFRMVSQTCGDAIAFVFSIDQVVVGSDSLRTGDNSPSYRTTTGEHVLRAAIENGAFVKDTTVTLGVGETHTQIVAPSCS